MNAIRVTNVVAAFVFRSLAKSSHSFIHCRYNGFAHSADILLRVDNIDFSFVFYHKETVRESKIEDQCPFFDREFNG